MKHVNRIFGIICFIISAALIAVAICGHTMSSSDSENIYKTAVSEKKLISDHQTSAAKTAPSTVKKAAAAVKDAGSALSTVQSQKKQAFSLIEKYKAGSSDEALLDAILNACTCLESIPDTETIRLGLSESAEKYIIGILADNYSSAYKAVSGAESKLDTAVTGIQSVCAQSYIELDSVAYTKAVKSTVKSIDAALDAFDALEASAVNLNETAASVSAIADTAQTMANDISASDSMSFAHKAVLAVGNSPIGFTFTGILFIFMGLILTFWFVPFKKAWKSSPLFSTMMALIVMTVIQIYALGFNFDGYGAWGNSWLKNILNVLRSNSSNGMIALGMTFVIITGGIDLAVGSSLAGIATVVMLILDVSANGKFTAMGLTGIPNYVVAITVGLLAGAALGAITGFGITKGRIPPFIFTLGVMNIVRSVAQYFTRSYKIEVPKAFQVIANQEIIGGQMLLPIIYWLILAVIMYVISKHTAFGKHIYAVGSNERTSRLSGINVDRVKILVYMLMGVIVAIAAITQVARLRGIDVASAGSGYEMNAIAAVVVGGTSMAGGRGSILGTVMGVLIIGIMDNLLVLLGIDAFLSNAFTGAIIIFAVLIQRKDK